MWEKKTYCLQQSTPFPDCMHPSIRVEWLYAPYNWYFLHLGSEVTRAKSDRHF